MKTIHKLIWLSKKTLAILFHQLELRFMGPLGLYDKSILNKRLSPEWETRINDVISCPDNRKITRHKNAGLIHKGKQFMHNGIPITLGGYYGSEITQMLAKNKGVHEPQEEYAFGQVLNDVREGAVIIELGCYWAFYSIWFLKVIKNSRAFMIEPDKINLAYGKNNFRLNDLSGDFTNAFVGSSTHSDKTGQFISVSDFIVYKEIDFIDILHSDIQGSEFVMLVTLNEMIKQNKIGYFFISTHSDETHYKCIDLLTEADYKIICHADMDNSFSVDGLIVARSPIYGEIEKIDISLKKSAWF